jgi:hypothetical protein
MRFRDVGIVPDGGHFARPASLANNRWIPDNLCNSRRRLAFMRKRGEAGRKQCAF